VITPPIRDYATYRYANPNTPGSLSQYLPFYSMSRVNAHNPEVALGLDGTT